MAPLAVSHFEIVTYSCGYKMLPTSSEAMGQLQKNIGI